LNESYARIVVDGARFKNLDAVGRKRFAARALKLAEATYLTEFAATDQYEEIFVVDEHGRALLSYQP
jgi:hypothetical protein